MVINALSVCVSVMFTSLLLTRPLPKIPFWLRRVALENDKTEPAFEDKSRNFQNEPENNITIIEKQTACTKNTDFDKIQELINKVSEVFSVMQKISYRLGEIDKENNLESQWKKIATRLNKILCLFFSMVLVIMFLVAGVIWVRI